MQLATQTAVLATRPPASHAQPPAAITTSAPHTHTRCPAHLGQQRQREGLPPEVLLGCHAQLAHEAAQVVVGVRPLQLLVAQGQLQLQLPHHALVDAPNLLQRKGRAHGRQGRAAQQGSGRAWQWVVTSTVGEWVVQDFSRQAKPDQSYDDGGQHRGLALALDGLGIVVGLQEGEAEGQHPRGRGGGEGEQAGCGVSWSGWEGREEREAAAVALLQPRPAHLPTDSPTHQPAHPPTHPPACKTPLPASSPCPAASWRRRSCPAHERQR